MEGVLKRSRTLEGDEDLYIGPSPELSEDSLECYETSAGTPPRLVRNCPDPPVYGMFMRLDGTVYFTHEPLTPAQAEAFDNVEHLEWEERMRYMLDIDRESIHFDALDPKVFRETFGVLREPPIKHSPVNPKDPSSTPTVFAVLGF